MDKLTNTTVHYHTAWSRPFETNVTHVDASDSYAVILIKEDEMDWTCGVDDGTMCVEDVADNRESTENYVLQDGFKAMAVDPADQAICDHWAALYADCWGA